MTARKKVLISIGLVLTILLGLGIYGNYKLNNIIDSMAQSGLFEIDAISPADTNSNSNTTTNTGGTNNNSSVNPDSSTSDADGSTADSVPESGISAADPQSLTPEQSKMVNGVDRYLGRKVDRRDVLTAGTIIINRFSWGEINYLYSVGSRKHDKNDLEQVRALLLSRLSAGDIATLTSLGHKYGLSLKILDASYPIR